MKQRRAWLGVARFYFEQLILNHPGWLVVHAVVVVHFLLNYKLGLLFCWLLLSGLPFASANLLPVHLPISRKHVFALSLLPSLVVLVVAVGISLGQTQSRGIGQGTELELSATPVAFEPRDKGELEARVLHVPAHLWQLSWGAPPMIELEEVSPIQPQSVQLFGALHAYNPYTVSLGDPLPDVGKQLSRALHDCCRISITPEQAATHARYAEAGGLDSLYEAARRLQSIPLSMLALQFWLTVVALLVTIRVGCRAFAIRRSWRRLPRLSTFMALGVFALMVGLYVGFVGSQSASADVVWTPLLTLQVALAQLARVTEVASWLFVPLAVASLWPLYRWAANRYSQLELPLRAGGTLGAASARRE